MGGAKETAASPVVVLAAAVAGEAESTAGEESGRRVSVVREPNSTKATIPEQNRKITHNKTQRQTEDRGRFKGEREKERFKLRQG